MVTPAGATNSAANGLVSHVLREGEVGRGEVNNASTWDEFPNGRFGDINSPAFGSQDLWGGFGRMVSAIDSDYSLPALRVDDRHPVAHVLVPSMTSQR